MPAPHFDSKVLWGCRAVQSLFSLSDGFWGGVADMSMVKRPGC